MSEETSNSGAEGGQAENVNPRSSADAQILTEEIKTKLAVFDNLDSQYKKDPVVKAVIDNVLNGKADKIADLFKEKKTEIKEAQSAGTTSEVDVLKAQLKSMEEAVSGMKQMIEANNIIGARSEIETAYQGEFSRLAGDAGFSKTFKGYSELYDLARLESQKLANKYGLVVKDSNGMEIPDILLNYNPELLKEAFDKAKARMQSLGFDVLDAKREAMVSERRLAEKNTNEEISKMFSKDNIKNRADLKRQLNNLFESRLRQKGLTLSDR